MASNFVRSGRLRRAKSRRKGASNRALPEFCIGSDVLRYHEGIIAGLTPAQRRKFTVRGVGEDENPEELIAETRSIFECVRLCLGELADPHDSDASLDCEISDVAILVKLGIDRLRRVKAACEVIDRVVGRLDSSKVGRGRR